MVVGKLQGLRKSKDYTLTQALQGPRWLRGEPWGPVNTHLLTWGSEAERSEAWPTSIGRTPPPAGPTPCSPPFLFLCYHFEEMEHDLFAFYLKSVACPIWGSYTKTKRNPKQGLFLTRHWGDGGCLGLSKWNVCPGRATWKASLPVLLRRALSCPLASLLARR